MRVLMALPDEEMKDFLETAAVILTDMYMVDILTRADTL